MPSGARLCGPPCARGHVDCASVAVRRAITRPIAGDLLRAGSTCWWRSARLDGRGGMRLVAAAEEGGRILQVGHLERSTRRSAPPRDGRHNGRAFSSATGSRRSSIAARCRRHSRSHDPRPRRDPELRAGRGRRVESVGVPILTPSVDIANARLRFADGCIANVTASRVLAETRAQAAHLPARRLRRRSTTIQRTVRICRRIPPRGPGEPPKITVAGARRRRRRCAARRGAGVPPRGRDADGAARRRARGAARVAARGAHRREPRRRRRGALSDAVPSTRRGARAAGGASFSSPARPSGDMHGADLIAALRVLVPDVECAHRRTGDCARRGWRRSSTRRRSQRWVSWRRASVSAPWCGVSGDPPPPAAAITRSVDPRSLRRVHVALAGARTGAAYRCSTTSARSLGVAAPAHPQDRSACSIACRRVPVRGAALRAPGDSERRGQIDRSSAIPPHRAHVRTRPASANASAHLPTVAAGSRRGGGAHPAMRRRRPPSSRRRTCECATEPLGRSPWRAKRSMRAGPGRAETYDLSSGMADELRRCAAPGVGAAPRTGTRRRGDRHAERSCGCAGAATPRPAG